MTTDETILRERLDETEAENVRLTGEVKRLSSALAQWETGDTVPPSPSEPTGDHTLDKRIAEFEMRLDNLEGRESARAGELQAIVERAEIIMGRAEQVLKLAERVTVIDPQDIITIRDAVLQLPCSGCGQEMRHRLSSIPGGKAE